LKKHLVTLLKFTLFLGIGLTILYLVYQKQNTAYLAECALQQIPEADCSLIQKIIDDFKGANFFWIFMVLVAYIISNISRAIRWHMLLKPLGYRPRYINSFFTIILGYFANLGLPRIGEVVRAATFSKYENIPVEKAMGTIVVDRAVDVLSLFSALGLVFLFEYDKIWSFLSENMGGGESNKSLWEYSWFQGFAIFGVISLIAVFLMRKKIQQTAFFQKAIKVLRGFWEGIKSIKKVDKPFLLIFHSFNIWFMYFMMTYLCFFAFEPTAGLAPIAGLMVFVFGAFGILIPSPGGMGTFHFLAIQALSMYGISGGDAFSFANILFFSVQLGCNVVVGIFALFLLPVVNRNYKPVPSTTV
jgi:glycosyltransferase 2 family protein